VVGSREGGGCAGAVATVPFTGLVVACRVAVAVVDIGNIRASGGKADVIAGCR
jgi:hypothetical protein